MQMKKGNVLRFPLERITRRPYKTPDPEPPSPTRAPVPVAPTLTVAVGVVRSVAA